MIRASRTSSQRAPRVAIQTCAQIASYLSSTADGFMPQARVEFRPHVGFRHEIMRGVLKAKEFGSVNGGLIGIDWNKEELLRSHVCARRRHRSVANAEIQTNDITSKTKGEVYTCHISQYDFWGQGLPRQVQRLHQEDLEGEWVMMRRHNETILSTVAPIPKERLRGV